MRYYITMGIVVKDQGSIVNITNKLEEYYGVRAAFKSKYSSEFIIGALNIKVTPPYIRGYKFDILFYEKGVEELPDMDWQLKLASPYGKPRLLEDLLERLN